MTRTGAEILVDTIAREGGRTVFGLPGSQTIELYEALRRSSLRTVLTGSELSAAFMANGYYRASGRVPVVATNPGPGFLWALPGLAEAYLDSAAVLWVSIAAADLPDGTIASQSIDARAMAAPVVKATYRVRGADEVADMTQRAMAHAIAGEPGPVLLELTQAAIDGTASGVGRERDDQVRSYDEEAAAVAAALRAAKRPALIVGAGAAGAADDLRALVERLRLPVIATTSGRGIVPEPHPLLVATDPGVSGLAPVLNGFLERCDLVIAIGWKASHNSTNGFRVRVPHGSLVHVDTSTSVLAASRSARLTIQADAVAFVQALRARLEHVEGRPSAWEMTELAEWRARVNALRHHAPAEPAITDGPVGTVAELFAALGRVLPTDGCVVADAGLHQVLTRRHLHVRSPRGLLLPANFQSMGFGVPAAIGAKLAAPSRAVVAIVGDGSMPMVGMELATAVRERVPMTVVLFNDASLGLIRRAQVEAYGRTHATSLMRPSYAMLAESLGVRYVPFTSMSGRPAEHLLSEAIAGDGVTLVDVRLRDSAGMRYEQIVGAARSVARRMVPRQRAVREP